MVRKGFDQHFIGSVEGSWTNTIDQEKSIEGSWSNTIDEEKSTEGSWTNTIDQEKSRSIEQAREKSRLIKQA